METITHTKQELKEMFKPIVALLKEGWAIIESDFSNRDKMPFLRLVKGDFSLYIEIDNIEAVEHYYSLKCPKCEYKQVDLEDYCPECDEELVLLGNRHGLIENIINELAKGE